MAILSTATQKGYATGTDGLVVSVSTSHAEGLPTWHAGVMVGQCSPIV